jgi:hypothetical protein
MTRFLKLVALAAMLLLARPVLADLKDIQKEKLPQEAAVLKAYSDVATVEEFTRDWSDKWRYERPKEAVVSLLKASLADLQKALSSSSDNVELLLLTGLIAHYAYNVDVEEAYDVAVNNLTKAQKLAPDDYRADWFLGMHECQSLHSKEGMQRFLSIEGLHSWDKLPVSFWDDYIGCATLANMPAHVLRAEEHLIRLNAPPSKKRDFYREIAQKRFKISDLNATYPYREVWSGKDSNPRWVFANTMHGFAFSIPADWKAGLSDVEKGVCGVHIETTPHAGKTGDVVPGIVILVRQPKPGETLADFVQTLSHGAFPTPNAASGCPAEQCMTFENSNPEFYKPEGGGHFIVIVFKREAPEFPGLLFEEPMGPPSAESGKVQYFHPVERIHRLDGTLYYLVGLDTASSVLDKAKADYESFLKTFQVE